jgi:hypothetical protein
MQQLSQANRVGPMIAAEIKEACALEACGVMAPDGA